MTAVAVTRSPSTFGHPSGKDRGHGFVRAAGHHTLGGRLPKLGLVSTCKGETVSPELSHLSGRTGGHSNAFFDANTGKLSANCHSQSSRYGRFITHPVIHLCHPSYLCDRWAHRHDRGLVWKIIKGEYGNCDQNFPFQIIKRMQVNRSPGLVSPVTYRLLDCGHI